MDDTRVPYENGQSAYYSFITASVNPTEIMKLISSHREHVFPTMKAPFNKPMNSQTVNAAIKRLGFGGRLVAHGFRSIASTALNEQGFASDVTEAALAHVEPRLQPCDLFITTTSDDGLVG